MFVCLFVYLYFVRFPFLFLCISILFIKLCSVYLWYVRYSFFLLGIFFVCFFVSRLIVFVYFFVCVFIYLYVSLSGCVFLWLFVPLSVCSSVCLLVCLFVLLCLGDMKMQFDGKRLKTFNGFTAKLFVQQICNKE